MTSAYLSLITTHKKALIAQIVLVKRVFSITMGARRTD